MAAAWDTTTVSSPSRKSKRISLMQAEAETLRDDIKQEMMARDTEEMEVLGEIQEV